MACVRFPPQFLLSCPRILIQICRPRPIDLPFRLLDVRNIPPGGPRRPVHTMRDRSKNRKPLQKGRNLSIEAIQTVHALKLSRIHDASRARVFELKVKRLIKVDMVAVLRELLRQDECLLALQVFDNVRKEHWYKPQVSQYAEIITVLAKNGMIEKVELLFSEMMFEACAADDEGFNSLVKTLMELNLPQMAVECFHLMKKVGSEPDESTFQILIDGMNSRREFELSASLREEAENQFGVPFEFLSEKEETRAVP